MIFTCFIKKEYSAVVQRWNKFIVKSISGLNENYTKPVVQSEYLSTEHFFLLGGNEMKCHLILFSSPWKQKSGQQYEHSTRCLNFCQHK